MCQPINEQLRGYVVWKICDDPTWRVTKLPYRASQGIILDKFQPLTRCRQQRIKHRCRTPVLFNRDYLLRALEQNGSRQTAGAGANLNGRSIQRCPRSGDASRQIKVKQKILAKRLPSPHIKCIDKAPQSRKSVNPVVASLNLFSRRMIRHLGSADM